VPTQNHSPYKVALLGLGAMGRRHARVFAALAGRFEVVGGFDVNAGACPPAGVALLRGELDAIARAQVVVVATPIEAHAATVTRALSAGRHVLVEKPLCAQADEARKLVARARAGGARLFVGHSERFNPVVRALARLVRGDPALTIELTREGPAKPCGSSVLLNLGVHDFDLAAYLGGGVVSVRATPGGGAGPASGEDRAHVPFETAAGAVGSIYVDRTAPARRRIIRLATARWIYEGDLLAHRLTRIPRAGGERSDVPLPREEPLAAQAVALADALDAGLGAPPSEIASGADGARAVALAEQAAVRRGPEAEKLSLLGSH
jgi:UDP-N-acetylglucosamine 3-dehydrogenase